MGRFCLVVTRDLPAKACKMLVDPVSKKEGFEVLDAGMVPTPALAFGVIDSNALLGVMVTASHNPHTDNGLKVFSQFGSKLSIEEEEAIESFIEPTDSIADSNGPFKEKDITGPYIKNLLTRFPKNILEGIKLFWILPMEQRNAQPPWPLIR